MVLCERRSYLVKKREALTLSSLYAVLAGLPVTSCTLPGARLCLSRAVKTSAARYLSLNHIIRLSSLDYLDAHIWREDVPILLYLLTLGQLSL